MITQAPRQEISSIIHLTIRDREKIIFRDNCRGLTSFDSNGQFDILPQHGNFISIISQYVRVYKTDGTSLAFPCTTGILKVINNTIEIYFGILQSNPAKKPEVAPVLKPTILSKLKFPFLPKPNQAVKQLSSLESTIK